MSPQPPRHYPPAIRPGLIAAIGIGLIALALPLDSGVTAWATGPSAYQVLHPLVSLILPAAGVLVLLAILIDYFAPRQWLGVVAPLILAAGITHLLKWLIGRARPRTELAPFHFEPLTLDADVASFPSGHTAYAVVVAGLLSLHLPRYWPLWVLLAALAGIERIIHREHYLSDVFGGALVGLVSLYLAYRALGPNAYRRAAAMGPR